MKARATGLIFILLLFLTCNTADDEGVISATGTIEAREVHVPAKMSGDILELPFDEGARVRVGDTLAVIDHAVLDIQLRQAEAGVDLAQAELALLKKGARREDIQQAEEQLNQARAALKSAGDDLRRMRVLAEKGSVTPKQRDDAEARYTVAEAQTRAAEEVLKKMMRLARPEEIRAAEARLRQTEAAADLLRKRIADCTVIAPVDGVVTHRPFEVGEMVAPGAALLIISELDEVTVRIYISEKDLGRVKLGDPADVTIDAYPEDPFPGKVTYISPEAEFTPKNIQTKEDRVKLVFAVKITVDNPEGLLKPGLPADAVIRIETPSE